MNVRFSSAAQSEIAQSAHFYLEESILAAWDFLEEIDEATVLIGRQPTLYPFYENDIRVKHLVRFPFSLFFKIRVDEVYILSVSHNSRKPDYWAERD